MREDIWVDGILLTDAPGHKLSTHYHTTRISRSSSESRTWPPKSASSLFPLFCSMIYTFYVPCVTYRLSQPSLLCIVGEPSSKQVASVVIFSPQQGLRCQPSSRGNRLPIQYRVRHHSASEHRFIVQKSLWPALIESQRGTNPQLRLVRCDRPQRVDGVYSRELRGLVVKIRSVSG